MDARTAAAMGVMPNVDIRRATPQRVSQGFGVASMALPSPFGDIAGLLSDGVGYASGNPLTPASGLLSMAGLIPGVPSMSSKALWVDSAGEAIKNKRLRKALEWVPGDVLKGTNHPSQSPVSIDEIIQGMRQTGSAWGEAHPLKRDILKAVDVLEEFKGQYFPGNW